MPNGSTTNALTVKASAKVGQKIITTKLFAKKYLEKIIFLSSLTSRTTLHLILYRGLLEGHECFTHPAPLVSLPHFRLVVDNNFLGKSLVIVFYQYDVNA